MMRIIIGNRVYWTVDGIVFSSLAAAVEYLQGR